MVRGIRCNHNVRVLFIFPDYLGCGHFEALAFKVNVINAVVVILGVIGLGQGRPGKAGLFYFVVLDRAIGISKAFFGERLRTWKFHFHGVATGLGSCFGPVKV